MGIRTRRVIIVTPEVTRIAVRTVVNKAVSSRVIEYRVEKSVGIEEIGYHLLSRIVMR